MQKLKNTEIKRALCFGCWLQAGVLATVEDGKVVKLRGEPGHPVNQGWICERSKAFIEHLYHEDRLNYPLKRIGQRGAGKWQRVSWDDALDEVAEKLDGIKTSSGAEAVASIGGTGRGFSELFKVRFMNLFGSPNHANAGQWCSVVSRQIHAAIYGAGASRTVKPPCKCAVIWGGNPSESFACIFPQHTKAKRKGTKYIVIDPKYSETARRLADHHLALRPGTDAALALGWLNVIIAEKLYDKDFVEKWCHGFDQLKERVNQYPPERVAEITRLPQDQIVQTARLYACSKPASIIWGVKSDMQGRNVTGITQAKCILRAITGNLDVIGGDMLAGPCEKANYGVMLEHMDQLSAEQRKKQLGADQHKLWCFPGYEMVAEQWMTPSAMLADYVFPITNWLEHPQMYTQTFQGSGSAAALGERVVSPLFERRSDFELYRGLGLKLGQKKYWRDTLDQEWDWCLQPLLKDLNLETSQDFAKTQRWLRSIPSS
jgi:anaerobic selenocysteine-containing dehydrogenase